MKAGGKFRGFEAGRIDFIRQKMAGDGPEEYVENTDIWIKGDVDGYLRFVKALGRAERTKRTTPFDTRTPAGLGMRVAIVPAKIRPMAPRIRFWERMVFVTDRPEMELVFYGNVAGYRRLAKRFLRISKSTPDGVFSDHDHFEDSSEEWIRPRSVYLNVRAPIPMDDSELIEEWNEFVRRSAVEHRIPKGMEYLVKANNPYGLITPLVARDRFPLSGPKWTLSKSGLRFG